MNYDFNYALTVFVDTVMKRYADFEGRTSRRDFWHYVSIALLIAVGLLVDYHYYQWDNMTFLLQKFIDAKKIDASAPITEESLVASGLVRRVKDGVRILNKGAITSKIDLTVSGASKTAIAAVEAAGGTLTVTSAAKADADA